MACNLPTTLVLVFLGLFQGTGSECIFPEFLWREKRGDTMRRWFTESRYIKNERVWESQKVIEIERTILTTMKKSPAPCPDYEGEVSMPCFKEEFIFHRYCLRERDGRYSLQEGEKGHEKYICMSFEQKSASVIQVWTGKLRDRFTEDLCDDRNLHRSEWPWHAAQSQWMPCPLQGGYDFIANLNEKKRRMCHKQWRPSRIESECIIGEGLNFLFPEKSCSPFVEKLSGPFSLVSPITDLRLQCWANWTEGAASYILLAEYGKMPQFVLRLPTAMVVRGRYMSSREMRGKLYFSPVAPGNERGIPPNNVMYASIDVSSSESGVCVDESTRICEDLAKDGKCGNEHINPCQKSCGYCHLAPSTKDECRFPLQYQGEWLLFENNRREDVTINKGQITFSTLGTFICKSKHWSHNYFKLLSVYDNGCRPRFSCIEFVYQENGNILRYRMSSADRTDKSFDLCEFYDDPQPLGKKFRSEGYKVLLPVVRTTVNSCGLGGLVYTDVIFADDGKLCHGTLSDWNPFSCNQANKMTMGVRSCKNEESAEQQEFKCEAYVNMQDNFRLLITRKEMDEDETYACWIIRMNPGGAGVVPWEQAYILYRAQCGHPEDLDNAIYKPAELTFKFHIKKFERDCIVINKGSTPHASTIRYILNKTNNARANSNTGNRKPYTTPARTAAVNDYSTALGSSPRNSCSGISVVSIALVFLALMIT